MFNSYRFRNKVSAAKLLSRNGLQNHRLRAKPVRIWSLTQQALWQIGKMRRSEIPESVVQFHGAPQKNRNKKLLSVYEFSYTGMGDD